MARLGSVRRLGLGALSCLLSCSTNGGEPPLGKLADDAELLSFEPPPEDGPKLGAIANVTPVLERPTRQAREIGYLHAGARVARSPEPITKSKDCPDGYYAVHPRGVVCVNHGATLDLRHPTLAAMAIQPSLDEPLPYAYARATSDTPLFERDPEHSDAVRALGTLKKGAGMAVVGSWTARVPDGGTERLALLPSGRFVRAADLGAARVPELSGQAAEDDRLAVAFVVKRGVSTFRLGKEPERVGGLDYHAKLPLSGRSRDAAGAIFLETADALWVRKQDVTSVLARKNLPEVARTGRRWIDVSVGTGTLVLYEGARPIFATLVATARPDERAKGASVRLGTFEVTSKHVTHLRADPERAGERFPVYDLPWALELSSGQLLYGAYFHDRFGMAQGTRDFALSPADARRVFEFALPELPPGWHAVRAEGERTPVVVRD
ncbi:MAG TPA: L,D-transpeptidase [Polyangiaceae bacterium]|nr:L,D-transpeptidase [Polyangiaceae bacterium]